jgi:hypothetical protein
MEKKFYTVIYIYGVWLIHELDHSGAVFMPTIHHGRIYFSKNYICFFSNIFGIRTNIVLPFSSIVSSEKIMLTVINPGISVKLADGKEVNYKKFQVLRFVSINLHLLYQEIKCLSI